ncbi:type II toxin-antitoxin system VapC family toxin [Candidatus Bathyarchaeota archaeon]|nr:type II toxin-antitoxin system VapC family toxin [Candidatus Bathyarchaeota archaeon]
MSELNKAILDASMLIQTLVRERYTDTALKLVGMLKAICVPSLILYEIGNALVILTRKNLITKEDAVRKFKSFSSIPTLNIMEPTLGRAIEIAIELKITLYDASYLALALEADAPLITADRELYDKGKKMAKVIHASEVIL